MRLEVAELRDVILDRAEDAEAVARLVVDELAVLRARAAVVGVVVELAPLEVAGEAGREQRLVVALEQVDDVVRDHRREPARRLARGGDVVADDSRGAHDRLELVGVAPRLLGGGARLSHDPVDDVDIGELDDDAVALAARDAQRPRAVAGDPDRDLGQILGPFERDLLVVPVGGATIGELADQLRRRLELAHLDGLQPDRAARRVATADHHGDAPGRHRVERRMEAGGDRRLARARVGDAEAEADALRRRRGGGEERAAVLPEDVRVVGVGPVEAGSPQRPARARRSASREDRGGS